ncbi:hypothetical protein BS50DRAFT_628631 [Corynespora cassiicola Philippines]|uniref:Uncharacterized protein n=1 Tax=Corynespora cassiicola Philippines TaxID=1448308 RepID=A0A2T2PD27_CORCC|nr:hypothetical protein BS50DRAFT_628631 [Corynespora cassiicola Philippines]
MQTFATAEAISDSKMQCKKLLDLARPVGLVVQFLQILIRCIEETQEIGPEVSRIMEIARDVEYQAFAARENAQDDIRRCEMTFENCVKDMLGSPVPRRIDDFEGLLELVVEKLQDQAR